ncbi:putative lectin-like domain protein [Brevundimonas phage vB_BpoS-Leszy]|nr:putative lectin-like domain protein [Brevundimonas phage vB_BpoS-Leszy]USN16441.1 putative lectin-like domain protein [Brevundimonas phage vB_BpoS-Poludnitsa]
MWAGAGGAGRYGANAVTSGASGFVALDIDLAAGDTLSIEVGGGGQPGKSSPVAEGGLGGWPDGGYGVRGDTHPGGGGGSSRVYLNGTLLAVCGAGGGSGGYSPGGNAGAGGGEVGQSNSTGNGGTGGTQTTGGVDANAPSIAAKKGGYLQGGLGGVAADRFTSSSDDGGGGGGGYYGGGGGGGDGHSGGGGSSWVNTALAASFINLPGNYDVPPNTDSPYYAADVGVGRPSVSTATGGLAGGDGRVVIDDETPPSPIYLSKTTTHVVLKYRSFDISKAGAAVVLRRKNQAMVNKASVALVLKEADPEPIDFEVMVSKASLAVVIAPGSNGPLTRISHAASEIVHGGKPSARITSAKIEVLQTRNGAAHVSNAKLEVLYTKEGVARATHASLEVLRSTAEVTVQALVSHLAVSYLYRPEGARIDVSQMAVEVLRTAETENERFAVISLMN